jgi:hypothetical protein
MELDAPLNPKTGDSIKSHCHINTNEGNDRFVGIKADADNVMVYFPIGYELPKTDAEIRMDIIHLIQVLSEFTTRDTRLLMSSDCSATQPFEFPFNAYKSVIDYYFSIGGTYYIEKEQVYITSLTGKQNWARTARRQMPLVQSRNKISSFVFTQFEVRHPISNDTKEITQINRFCVYEAFKKIGWLYVPYMPEEPGPHPDIKTSIRIVQAKLANTNDDKKRALFRGMRDMLAYMGAQTPENHLIFGTDSFEHVWEKLVDRAFGVKDKEKFFPHSRWLLKAGMYNEKRPLIPDTIMIHNNKYYILDAKYYKYGCTGNPDHLPNGSSINKQITYGEYLEKYKGIDASTLFNAFIMPYNMVKNHFGFSSFIGNIGEAIGDWRYNKKYYERIQGIVIDTRYLMYNYSGKPVTEKIALSKCIETALTKGGL